MVSYEGKYFLSRSLKLYFMVCVLICILFFDSMTHFRFLKIESALIHLEDRAAQNADWHNG